MSDLRELLFPDPPRMFPGRRAIRGALRAAHVAAAGVLLGGHAFGVASDRLAPFLWVALATGALLVVSEIVSTFAFLVEVRGVVILLKIALLAVVPLWWDARAYLLLAVLVLSVVTSHAQGTFRHRLLFLRDRVRPSRGND